MRNISWAILASCVAMPAFTQTSQTGPAQPLAFSNQSPIVLIYGLPSARGPQVLAQDKQELNFTVDYTSHFIDRDNSVEDLILDGETTRIALNYRRGLGYGWEANIEIPFIDHSGGIADGFLDGFHDFTGFADGGRDNGPRDRQLYRYIRNGETLLNVDDSPAGLGDIRLGAAKDLALSKTIQTSLNAQLKLPTGDAGKLTGSESTDFALWLTAGQANFLFDGFSIVGAAGGLYAGEGEVLENQRVQGVGFGWISLGYAWTENFVTKAQLYVHSQLYDESRLTAVEGIAVQGGAGFTWRFSQATEMDLSIIEDLNAEASPDVTFSLALRQRF